jgi:predicted transcriptional regulator
VSQQAIAKHLRVAKATVSKILKGGRNVMANENPSDDISRKLNVLVALSVRQLLGDKDFTKGKRSDCQV